MSTRIIKNYKVVDDGVSVTKHNKFPKIIKKPEIAEDVKEINPENNTEKVAKKSPVITEVRDKHGIITSINIECGCGEKFSIDIQYDE